MTEEEFAFEVWFIAFRSFLCFAAYFTMPSLFFYLLYTNVDPITTADEELKAVSKNVQNNSDSSTSITTKLSMLISSF